MIPVLTVAQVREADAYTIKNEPIASIDLMERASRAFVARFSQIAEPGKPVFVFAGPGNNGGDALAVARLLKESGHRVEAYVVGDPEKASQDCKVNYKRLTEHLSINKIEEERHIPNVGREQIIIEGLFGSGLSRPVTGLFAEVIAAINASGSQVFSVDIPSGLFADSLTDSGAIVHADHTISFQVPKLTFFQPSSYPYTGEWHVVDIGLDQKFIESRETPYYLTESTDLRLPTRSKYAHKGQAGRLLLISGSKGKVGATILAARAAMRAGCGLLFVHAPHCATNILQVSIPEAMVLEDDHQEIVTEIPIKDHYNSIAVGPGLGTNKLTQKALEKLIADVNQPMILDADAINILAENQDLVDLLPKESILTPHPGEFKRLVGEWKDDFQKLDLLRSFCKRHQLNVVLKGAFSAVCNSSGIIHFNPSGNPGMATAGSGDVLTGIISAFLGQGMEPFDALKTGVYIHGLAGDLACDEKGAIAMIASDIIEKIPSAIKMGEK